MRLLKFISDLHLERREGIITFTKNHYNKSLIIPGDIGSPLKQNYWDFMDYVSDNFEKVYFTTGNHEYWNNNKITINQIDNLIEDKIVNYNNVYFLNNKVIHHDEYEIIGTILWSYPKLNIKNSFDFKYIHYDEFNNLNPLIMRELYIENMLWLTNKINENNNDKIVVTHYLPSYDFCMKHHKYLMARSLFASSLDYLIKPPVKYWLFGHTHDNFMRKKNNVYCCVNAFGRKKKYDLKNIYL